MVCPIPPGMGLRMVGFDTSLRLRFAGDPMDDEDVDAILEESYGDGGRKTDDGNDPSISPGSAQDEDGGE